MAEQSAIQQIADIGAAQSYDAFFCHNADDKDLLGPIYEGLAFAGLKVFYSSTPEKNAVPPVKSWVSVEQEAFKNSRFICVVVGPNGYSEHHEREIDQVIATKRPFIPVLLPNTLPNALEKYPALQTRNYVQFQYVDSQEADFRQQMNLLHKKITGHDLPSAATLPRRLAPVAMQPEDRPTRVINDIAGLLRKGEHARTVSWFVGRSLEGLCSGFSESVAMSRGLFRELVSDLADDYKGFLPAVDDLGTFAINGAERDITLLADMIAQECRAAAVTPTFRAFARILRAAAAAERTRPTVHVTKAAERPIAVVSTSLGNALEHALLSEAVSFVRVIPLTLGTEGDQKHSGVVQADICRFDVAPDASSPTRVRVNGLHAIPRDDVAALDDVLMGSGQRRPLGGPNEDTDNGLQFEATDRIVVIKYFGCLSQPASCVLSRADCTTLAQLSAQPNHLHNFLRTAVNSGPSVFLGMRPFDPDFLLMYETALRGVQQNISKRRVMPLPRHPASVVSLADEIERRHGPDVRRKTSSGFGIEILDLDPSDFLDRLAGTLGSGN